MPFRSQPLCMATLARPFFDVLDRIFLQSTVQMFQHCWASRLGYFLLRIVAEPSLRILLASAAAAAFQHKIFTR